jgi:hypothetical protein
VDASGSAKQIVRSGHRKRRKSLMESRRPLTAAAARPKRALILLLIAVPLLVAAFPAATARSAHDANEPAKARLLAQALVKPSTLKARVATTLDALQEGGITVLRGQEILKRGTQPESGARLDLLHAVLMAMDAPRGHAGPLTLRDFGRLLAAAKVIPRSESDRFVIALMNSWIGEARADPGNPHAFVPLFLAEMAKRRAPGIDLTGLFKPQNAHLTELEWILLSTALDRGTPSGEATRSVRTLAAHRSDKPCSDLDDQWKKLFNDKPGSSALPGPNDLLKHLAKKAIETAVKKAGGDQDAAKAVSITLKLAKIWTRFHALALFYHSATIRVFPQEADSVHKGVGRTVLFHMSAIAGLNEAAKKELETADFERSTLMKAFRDCAKAAGLPVPEDVKDIADGLDKWRIRWRDFGSTTLALVNARASKFDYPGRQAHRLRRVNDTEGVATLAIDIQEENPKIHNDPDAQLVHGTWGVTADLEAAKPPDPKKIKAIVDGALAPSPYMEVEFGVAIADSITDILANWTLAAVTPNDRGTLDVTEHVPCTRQLRAMIRLHLFRQTGGPTCGDPVYPKRFVGSATWKSDARYFGPDQSGEDHANVKIDVTFVHDVKSRVWYVVDHGTVSWTESGWSASSGGSCSWQGSGAKPLDKHAAVLTLAWSERERAFRASFSADEGVGPFPLVSSCSGVIEQGAENPLFPLSRATDGFRVDPDALTFGGSDSHTESSSEAEVTSGWTWDFRGAR